MSRRSVGAAARFAEFEREIIRERVVADMARPKATGVTFGRPRIEPQKEQAISRRA